MSNSDILSKDLMGLIFRRACFFFRGLGRGGLLLEEILFQNWSGLMVTTAQLNQ